MDRDKVVGIIGIVTIAVVAMFQMPEYAETIVASSISAIAGFVTGQVTAKIGG